MMRFYRLQSPYVVAFALVACSLIGRAQAVADEAPADQAPSTPRAFGPSGDFVRDARAQSLGRKLRCPVCQGMPINESPATMAVDMMQQVRKMLRQGQTDDEILAYFTSRYGQWVLLEPPHDGFALWIWILPPVCCVGLLALAWRIVWRLRDTQQPGLPLEFAAPQASIAPPSLDAVSQAEHNPDETQALLAAIRQEVDLS